MVSLTDPTTEQTQRALDTTCPLRLSKRCEYGIKAAAHLAHRQTRGYTQSREIAAAEGLPAKFLESILLALKSGSFLESKVGAGGGYKLAKDPRTILVTELIEALEPGESTGTNGNRAEALPETNGNAPCPPSADLELPAEGQQAINLLNRRLDEVFDSALGSMTLFDLAHESRVENEVSAV